ncbi:MAG: hypothetical protein LBQ75_09830, partial [Zoogloeaceae bacterium]|nr:hypothetical protein [Zoogloeaceae bacterium]
MNSINTTEPFDTWFAAMTDMRAKARITARIDMAESGNFGDCGPVGGGLSEIRSLTMNKKRQLRQWDSAEHLDSNE